MYSSTLDLIYVGNEKDMLMIEGSADQITGGALRRGAGLRPPGDPADHRGHQRTGQARRQAQGPLRPCRRDARGPRHHRARGPRRRISDAIFGHEKSVRSANIKGLKAEAHGRPHAELGAGRFSDVDLAVVFEELQYKAYRKTVLERGVRADGRDATAVRPISRRSACSPACMARAMFQRGDTQSLVITTLGPTKEAQDMDGLTGGATSKSFILHYNFPPFSVGETGRTTGPGRREIGHGALAERSLVPVLPPEDVFPYSIRVTSEIMASNGSTSMASICGGCLSLMDAGVPIIAPVAGISCGLITENGAGRRDLPLGHDHRHPRRGRPFRRHGFQAGRHDQGHHGLPARPQDPRPAL